MPIIYFEPRRDFSLVRYGYAHHSSSEFFIPIIGEEGIAYCYNNLILHHWNTNLQLIEHIN